MTKKIVFIALLSIIIHCLHAQKEEKGPLALINKIKFDKANGLFSKLAYSGAAEIYEDLVSSQYKVKEVYPKLGDCYYYMSNTEKAETYYKLAVTCDSSITAEYYFKYAQTLRSNGKYSESEKWINRYHDFFFTDARVQSYNDNKEFINKLLDHKSAYAVKERKDLNSIYADFGAVPFENKLVFTSGRTDNIMVGTFFAWNGKPFLDLYVYDTSNLVKSKIAKFNKKLNSKYHEGPVCFTKDFKTVYFTRDNYFRGKRNYSSGGTTHLMIFRADYINGEWTNIVPLPFNNNEYSAGHPALSPDGKRLYFASNMPGTYGISDIFYVEINGNTYGEPVNLGPNINTEGNEMFPFVTENGLYFSSDGNAGIGGLDIFFAKFLPEDQIDKPVNLGIPLNSPKDDFSYFVKDDNRSGYFASNRPGGTGDDDIYEFTINQLLLKGVIRDTSNQNTPLIKANISLLKADSTLIEKLESDSSGVYSFNVAFDNNYIVKASKTGYKDNTKNISTKGLKLTEINQNINLGIDRPFILSGKISDRKTGKALSDVELTIVDTVNQKLIIDTKTGTDGLFKKQLENVHMKSHLAYRVMLRKTGYLVRTLALDHYIKDYEINLNEFLDISLDKIAVGVDIGKLLSINPIYFDLGKWDIRPDAAIELDKIVQAMKDNPTVVIELGSHTDSRGSTKSNLDLSDKRAKSSADYIISQGIDSKRIYGKGYGESRIINKCKDGVKCTEEEHAQNRRTEFKVVKI